MRCANHQCDKLAEEFFGGTLWLVERDVPPTARLTGDESGFPVCAVPSRYFWLCRECSRSMAICGWTGTDVLLGPSRPGRKPVESEAHAHNATPGVRSPQHKSLARSA